MGPKAISTNHYHVFLASPGDMNPEREYVREFFHQFNISTAQEWGVQFDVVDWENYATAGVGRPQQLITEATLERYEGSLALVVGWMGGRFGTPTGEAESGTEEEFRWAVEHWRKTGWPEIKWFFKQKPTFEGVDDPRKMAEAAEQWKKVREFQRSLQEGKPQLFYQEFEDFAGFKEVFPRDLHKWLNERERPWFKPVALVVSPSSDQAKKADREDRGDPGPRPPNPDLVHPYPLQPNFTGRIAERKWLTEWFTADSRPVCVVEAIGGMGKSALAWVWLHADMLGKPPAGYPEADAENLRVPEEQRPEGVLFWSFYERDAHFGAFLDRAARYVGSGNASTAGLSDREKLDNVLRALEQRRILLILDGFERELRAYAGYRGPYQGDVAGGGDENDCVDPRAAEFLRSAAALALAGRVLLTSRLFPNELSDLAGCRHERLVDLAPDDVVSFFEAAGVKGTRAEIAQAVAPYGGHPLSVSLLARAILKDRKMRGDIKASGPHTVLDKMRGKESHHILEIAYSSVKTDRRNLLSRIAAFRNPMDYEALLVFSPFKTEEKFDAALGDLEARGLLSRDPNFERYDLHPIVRQYAYDRLENKAGAHRRLLEYFQARPTPERVETQADLAPTIELYWHTVGADRLDAAVRLFHDRLAEPLYFRFGAYEQIIELVRVLLRDDTERSPQIFSESHEAWKAWILNALAASYSACGQPRRAIPLLEMQNKLRAKSDESDNKRHLSVGLVNLADSQFRLGRLEAAEGSLQRGIELAREIEDAPQEALGLHEHSRLLGYEGRFVDAQRELELITKYYQKKDHQQAICLTQAYWALVALLRDDPQAGLVAARESRQLADVQRNERDIIRAEWLLGWAHTALGETAAAEPHLNEALTRCRRINLVELEPSILLAWARRHHAGGDHTQARRFAEDALRIADRCEYRLNQADIHNFLARLALDSGKPAEARDQAQKAKDYAYCDGPPHYYKPAHEEAERLLKATEGAQHLTLPLELDATRGRQTSRSETRVKEDRMDWIGALAEMGKGLPGGRIVLGPLLKLRDEEARKRFNESIEERFNTGQEISEGILDQLAENQERTRSLVASTDVMKTLLEEIASAAREQRPRRAAMAVVTSAMRISRFPLPFGQELLFAELAGLFPNEDDLDDLEECLLAAGLRGLDGRGRVEKLKRFLSRLTGQPGSKLERFFCCLYAQREGSEILRHACEFWRGDGGRPQSSGGRGASAGEQ